MFDSNRDHLSVAHGPGATAGRRRTVTGIGAAALLLWPLVAASEPRPGLTVTQLDGSFGQHSIMVGSDGLPVIAYTASDWQNGLQPLKVAHCEDIACTTATLTEVYPDPGPSYISGAALTIGPDGFPLVSFIDDEGDLRVAHCGDVACATATISAKLYQHSGASRLSHTAITTGIDGLGLVAFHDPDRDWAFTAHCNDADCGSAQVVVISPNAARTPAITIGGDGYAVMAFMDTDGALTAAHCQNLTCSLNDQSIVDATAGYHGFGTSITIGNDGLPLISYLSSNYGSDKSLRVAHCNDGRCSTSVRTTLTPPTFGFEPTSISVGSDGLGVIAYSSDVEVRLAHCGNVACTTAGRLVAVPEVPFGRTGIDTSMTIGTDGLPIIVSSYYSEMKVAHLSDRFGLPYHRRR